MLVVVGLSHRTAPIEVRERLAIGRDDVPSVLDRLLGEPAIGEAVVLSTCNRVEVYAATRGRAGKGAELEAAACCAVKILSAIGGERVTPHLHSVRGSDAVLHLFRVAASLDSLVVGEPQILGQLKDAIEVAKGARALGARLGNAMHRAVRVGKRVRSETAIGAGQVSVSTVAIDLARQIFGDLEGRVALLVGAGEMAEGAARLLVRAGARLLVVNRSPDRAGALAREVTAGAGPGAGTAAAMPYAELERALVEADIVVSSTSSPHYVVTLDMVKRARRARKGRSLFLIDIAVPRDVDPAVNKLENVYLYDVDDLSTAVSESLEGRAVEAARAERIAVEEARGFEVWTLEQALTPAIVGLRAGTRAVLAAEVERSLSGKLRHLPAADREALFVMVEAATNKLLHRPVTRLRSLAADPRAGEYVETLRELFDLPELGAVGGPAGEPETEETAAETDAEPAATEEARPRLQASS